MHTREENGITNEAIVLQDHEVPRETSNLGLLLGVNAVVLYENHCERVTQF